MAEEKFRYDPEADDENNARKYRLPFALCKAQGIAVQDWWTPRDAWNALKNHGVVEDVSDEYKDYFRRLKKERAKFMRELGKPRRDARAKQRRDPEHNPDKNYEHVDGAIAGAKKGKPMTFEEADSGRCNPFFDQAWNQLTQKGLIGYYTNCQTCVATYVARRNGYDVRALPNLDNANIMQLSYNPMLAYIDENGNHPERIAKPRKEKTVAFLERNVEEGKIYSVSVGWVGRSAGHIVTAERINGRVQVYDPQTNKKYVGDAITGFFRHSNKMRLADLTNVRLDEKFCDSIMKKSGGDKK